MHLGIKTIYSTKEKEKLTFNKVRMLLEKVVICEAVSINLEDFVGSYKHRETDFCQK